MDSNTTMFARTSKDVNETFSYFEKLPHNQGKENGENSNNNKNYNDDPKNSNDEKGSHNDNR